VIGAPGRAQADGEAESLILENLDHNRQTKTAEELRRMISEDLSKVDGCPKRGVNVTVYGIPWNAMLMFGTAAGTVPNKAELLEFFEIIKERLQRLYDVSVPDSRE
jgi:hypothetical protein